MPVPGATRKEIDDLMKYDGVYHKITAHDIECGCYTVDFQNGLSFASLIRKSS